MTPPLPMSPNACAVRGFCLPFELPALGLRGRLIRLDSVSSRALSAHPLPEPAQRVLAEALVLAALLGSALKFEGRLSVQLKGNGPLDMLVTDYFAGAAPGGGLRGYARLDEQTFAPAARRQTRGLAGSGPSRSHRADEGARRPIRASSRCRTALSASAETYFLPSEQLPTALRLRRDNTYRRRSRGGRPVRDGPGHARTRSDRGQDHGRLAAHRTVLEALEATSGERDFCGESCWQAGHEDEVLVHPSRRCARVPAGREIRSVRAPTKRGLKDLPEPTACDPHALRILRDRLRVPLATFAQ